MVKGIEAKSSYNQGEKFLHGLDKGEITEPVDFVPSNEDVMSMRTLVQNYENEVEHIEVMFRLEEQFISYSDRNLKIWKLKI